MPCVENFYNHTPFQQYEFKGKACATAKRAIIGLIIGAILGTIAYYTTMSCHTVWNPFNTSLYVHRILAITNASLAGLVSLIIPKAIIYEIQRCHYNHGSPS